MSLIETASLKLLQDKLKLPHKLLILISVPLFFELVFVGSLIVLQRQAEVEAAQFSRSQRTIAETNNVVRLIYEASTAFFIFSVTDSPKSEERFKTNLVQIPQSVTTMKELVAHDATESACAKRIARLADRITTVLSKAYQEKLRGSLFWRSMNLRLDLFKMTDALVNECYTITEKERAQEQKDPGRESHWRNLVVLCLLAGVTGSVLLTAGLVLILNQDILKRLSVMMDNAHRFSSQLPLNAPVSGKDEIAQLDLTFHNMADALSAEKWCTVFFGFCRAMTPVFLPWPFRGEFRNQQGHKPKNFFEKTWFSFLSATFASWKNGMKLG